MKKKILITLLTITMAFGVVACGNDSASKNNSGKQDSAVESGSTTNEGKQESDNNTSVENEGKTSDSASAVYDSNQIMITVLGQSFDFESPWSDIAPVLDAAGFDTSQVVLPSKPKGANGGSKIDSGSCSLQVNLYQTTDGINYIESFRMDSTNQGDVQLNGVSWNPSAEEVNNMKASYVEDEEHDLRYFIKDYIVVSFDRNISVENRKLANPDKY